MTEAGQDDLDQLLAKLEAAISLLAVGSAPLDELVAAHDRATRLLAEAQSRLAALKLRAEQLRIAD
jgi:exodeoxyribonuclease VII small subunit